MFQSVILINEGGLVSFGHRCDIGLTVVLIIVGIVFKNVSIFRTCLIFIFAIELLIFPFVPS